jgi:hypothetical protein
MPAGGYSATTNHHRLLTTPSHSYSGDATRQYDSMLLTMFGISVRHDRMLPPLLKSSFATPSHYIGCQPLRGHLLGSASLCNFPTLGYKSIGQPPKALNKSHDEFTQAHEHSFHTQQYNSSGHRVLHSDGLNHLKILVFT